MQFEARLIAVKTLLTGDTVGYKRTYQSAGRHIVGDYLSRLRRRLYAAFQKRHAGTPEWPQGARSLAMSQWT